MPRSDPTLRRESERVLILAPRGRNAELIERSLLQAGMTTRICNDVASIKLELQSPRGAVVLSEEALDRAGLQDMVGILSAQPPWSEIPVLMLTSGGKTTRGSLYIAEALGPRGNVTLLERPIRIITLISAIRSALRSRRRQYEVHELLAREQTARSQAEAASRAKDQFLATLSHELRTPLNPVLITVSSMLQDPSLPARIRDDVDLIKRNVELESKLIDDLLDLTRITRGKVELHLEAVDVHALLDHAIKTCAESDITDKEIKLIRRAHAEQHYVHGDAARLSQVLWNLLKNAVKFTPRGGSISVETSNPTPDVLSISVEDTGVGIDAEAINRIFDAFEQADRSITRQFGGLGLGLAICKALVALHGGTVTAESRGKDKGSKFIVTMPAMSNAAAEPSQSDPTDAPVDRGLDVLLVEDHDSTAKVMARLLKQMDHRVMVAQTISKAQQLMDSERFDIVVSDLGLPDGSGLDLIRGIRRQSRIPAIAISGYGMEEDIRQSKEAGFNLHLVKPIDVSKLQAAIQRVTRDLS